jgi:hypothetical protein
LLLLDRGLERSAMTEVVVQQDGDRTSSKVLWMIGASGLFIAAALFSLPIVPERGSGGGSFANVLPLGSNDPVVIERLREKAFQQRVAQIETILADHADAVNVRVDDSNSSGELKRTWHVVDPLKPHPFHYLDITVVVGSMTAELANNFSRHFYCSPLDLLRLGNERFGVLKQINDDVNKLRITPTAGP